MDNKLLVVIDAQNDFITGTLGTPEAVAAVSYIQELVQTAVNLDWDIAYTMDTHGVATYSNTEEGKHLPILHCIFNSEGWELHPNVQCPSYYPAHYIIKHGFGSTKWANEFDLLKYDEIIVCGFVTSICVLSNICVIKAFEPNAKITLIKNATADISEEQKIHALKVLEALQVNIIDGEEYVTTEEN